VRTTRGVSADSDRRRDLDRAGQNLHRTTSDRSKTTNYVMDNQGLKQSFYMQGLATLSAGSVGS
jgi:hypothetical protein